MIIDFDKNEQEFFLNIKHENGLIFVIDNQYSGQKFEVVLDEFLVKKNDRYSQYNIPTNIFDSIDNGTYHYRILTHERKRIISGHLTAKDSNYSSINYDNQIENTTESNNKTNDDYQDFLNVLFD